MVGKQKRQRRKFHAAPITGTGEKPSGRVIKSGPSSNPKDITPMDTAVPPKISLLKNTTSNIFEGVTINFNSLNKDLPSDAVSVKSHKSTKSEPGKETLSKKDKLKLRRQMFLKKLDAVNELKKQRIEKKKRVKKGGILGDTNPLYDALPSLESLLKKRGETKCKVEQQDKLTKKNKGIEKSRKQKKKFLQGIQMYKQILNNKQFNKEPLISISQHIKNISQT